jgi:hypothetical protein
MAQDPVEQRLALPINESRVLGTLLNPPHDRNWGALQMGCVDPTV